MHPRIIDNRELADLPESWENSTVDTSKYYQCVLKAWEVDIDTYKAFKSDGALCQEHDNRFFIA